MFRRGHPILGTLSGLILGISVTALLLSTSTIALNSIIVLIAPIVGIVGGLALALVAPWGGRGASTASTSS